MAERDLSGKSRQEPQPAGPHGVDADGVEQEDVPPCPPGRQQQAGDKHGKPQAIKSRVQDGHVLDITRLEVAGRPHTHSCSRVLLRLSSRSTGSSMSSMSSMSPASMHSYRDI